MHSQRIEPTRGALQAAQYLRNRRGRLVPLARALRRSRSQEVHEDANTMGEHSGQQDPSALQNDSGGSNLHLRAINSTLDAEMFSGSRRNERSMFRGLEQELESEENKAANSSRR
jgi:hypothetical protein